MVVLGGWYLYRNEGAVNSNPRLLKVVGHIQKQDVMVYWADCNSHGYADVKHLTPVPDGLNQILSDSIKEE